MIHDSMIDHRTKQHGNITCLLLSFVYILLYILLSDVIYWHDKVICSTIKITESKDVREEEREKERENSY